MSYTPFAHEELAKFYDEWPGGLDEIESALLGHKRRIAELETYNATRTDELAAAARRIAELEADLERMTAARDRDHQQALENGALANSFRADAERYRWLMEHLLIEPDLIQTSLICYAPRLPGHFSSVAEFLDAARKDAK